jgi:hypothetical protein
MKWIILGLCALDISLVAWVIRWEFKRDSVHLKSFWLGDN